MGAIDGAGGRLDVLLHSVAADMLAGSAAGVAFAVCPLVVAALGVAVLALAVVPIVAQGRIGDGLAGQLFAAVGAGDHLVMGAIDGAGGGLDVLLHGIAAGVVRALGALPRQHGIAAVDAAQIPLEAVAQRGGHGLGLQLVGGFHDSGGVAVADALVRRTRQIVSVGDGRVCPADRGAHGVAAGFAYGDLAGGVAVGQGGLLHIGHQAADEVLRGGDGAGIVYIPDGGLLGVSHDAAHIGAAAGDSAGVIAAGHGACVELIAETAQVLHAGHIALVAAVGDGAVDQRARQTAGVAGIADLGVHADADPGDHAGDVHIPAVAHHTGHIAGIDGKFACGLHAAGNGQIFDGGTLIRGALHIAEQAQIDPITGGSRLIVDGQAADGVASTVKVSGKGGAIAADGRPVDAAQADVRRQHAGDGGVAAVDLLGKPDQLIDRADLIHAALQGGDGRGLHGNGALSLYIAALGGDGGGARLHGGDGAVDNGDHRVVGGCPDDGLVGGVLRRHRGGQPGGVALIQGQGRLVQRHAGGQNGRQHGDGAFRLHAAAGGGNGGGARLHSGDGAVLDGGHRVIGGGPHHGVGGVLRCYRSGQRGSFGGPQGQLRLVQRDAGGGNGLHCPLNKQVVGGDRHGVHNGQIGQLAVVRRGELHQRGRLLGCQHHAVQLRGGQSEGIDALFVDKIHRTRARDHQKGGVLDLDGHSITAVHRDLIGVGAVGAVHLGDGAGRFAHLHGDGARRRLLRLTGGALLKPHRHVVIGEVGGLGEAVAVVAGAGDVEGHLADLAQAGQIPLRPVHDDVVGAIAQVEGGLAGFGAVGIVAGGHQLHPVVRADLGGQAVAVHVAVQGVGGVGDIHVVNDPGRAVGKRQGGQGVRAEAVSGVVGIAVMHGEVIGAVVAAAGAGQAGNALLIDRKLRIEAAVGGDLAAVVVGNSVAAAPIAPGAVALGEDVVQPGVIRVRPLIGGVDRVDTHAAAVQQLAAVLGLVDQAAPVGAACEVGAALIVGILKGQHPQLIVLRREGADRQQRYRQQQRQQQ